MSFRIWEDFSAEMIPTLLFWSKPFNSKHLAKINMVDIQEVIRVELNYCHNWQTFFYHLHCREVCLQILSWLIQISDLWVWPVSCWLESESWVEVSFRFWPRHIQFHIFFSANVWQYEPNAAEGQLHGNTFLKIKVFLNEKVLR